VTRHIDLTGELFPVEPHLRIPPKPSALPHVRAALEWYGRMKIERDPRQKVECRRRMIKAVCRA